MYGDCSERTESWVSGNTCSVDLDAFVKQEDELVRIRDTISFS